jgi:hypothetical protein
MSEGPTAWDGGLVRTWLDRRLAAARLDQSGADRRGYEARDEYDKAAAEEWVCRALKDGGKADDRMAFAAQIKALVAQDDYPVTGIHDDQRFERHVRTALRKVAKMTKTNEGFGNTLRYQG